MNESLSIGEIFFVFRKRRRKYCVVFECNNSVYDVNGIYIIIILLSLLRTFSEEIGGVYLLSGDIDRMILLFLLLVFFVMSIF